MLEKASSHLTGYAMIAVGLLAGLAHGAAAGSRHAALLQLSGALLLAVDLFLAADRRRTEVLLLTLTGFWIASNSVSLRWLAGGLMSPQALGMALGGGVFAVATIALSSTSILFTWAALALSSPLRSDALRCALIAGALVAGDLVRELILPGFPWAAIAYAHVDSPFASLLPLIGAQGTSWVVEFCSLLLGSLCASLLSKQRVQRALIGCLAAILLCAGFSWQILPRFSQDGPTLRIVLMQTALSTREKFAHGLLTRHITDIADFVRTHDAFLTLTPETAIPELLGALTDEQRGLLENSISPAHALIVGAFSQDSHGEIYNSAVMLTRSDDASSSVMRSVHIKRHLAPIGEYAPIGFRWLADLLDLPISRIKPTTDARTDFAVGGITVIASVCMDLLYGGDLRSPSHGPRILVNLSNPAFFSSPTARDQFIDIARTRALEQQVPVLIAANYAPTAVIDADGTLRQLLRAGEPGSLELNVRASVGTTPYTRFGDFFPLLVLLTSLATASALARARLGSHQDGRTRRSGRHGSGPPDPGMARRERRPGC